MLVLQGLAQLPRLLCDPFGRRMGSAAGAGPPSPPITQLDDKKHIQDPQPGGFHCEEIASNHLVGIVPEKSSPIGAALCSLWCWWYLLAFEDIANCGAADLVAQLEQFAMQAAIVPTGVFPRQLQQQFEQLGITLVPSDKRLLIKGPFATDKLTMPPQDQGSQQSQGVAGLNKSMTPSNFTLAPCPRALSLVVTTVSPSLSQRETDGRLGCWRWRIRKTALRSIWRSSRICRSLWRSERRVMVNRSRNSKMSQAKNR